MNHRLVRFQSGAPGAACIENLSLGQAMHSALGPWEEAQAVYIQQSRLAERLRLPFGGPCVVYDVGLGIAANALAVIAEAKSVQGARDLHLVSFENDLSGLRLALEHSDAFPFLDASAKTKICALLENGFYQEPGLHWSLREGSFAQTLSTAPFGVELVFYDFYSPAAQPELWTLKLFEELRTKVHPRGGRWISYSSATAVKVALILAGFRVAQGAGTAMKRETTVAAWGEEQLAGVWGASQLEHILRSTKRWPLDVANSIQEARVTEAVWLARVQTNLA